VSYVPFSFNDGGAYLVEMMQVLMMELVARFLISVQLPYSDLAVQEHLMPRTRGKAT
jgi:hypothetical protein